MSANNGNSVFVRGRRVRGAGAFAGAGELSRFDAFDAIVPC